MNTLTTVSSDVTSLISLDEIREFLNATENDDLMIQAMIRGSVAYVEAYLNQTVGNNSYLMSMDSFCDKIQLMRPPVSTLDKIEYVAEDGALTELPLEDVKLNKDQGIVYLKAGSSWPSIASEPFAVHLSYTCEGNPSQDIMDAVKMVVAYRYDWRDNPNQRWRKAADDILRPLRIIPF